MPYLGIPFALVYSWIYCFHLPWCSPDAEKSSDDRCYCSYISNLRRMTPSHSKASILDQWMERTLFSFTLLMSLKKVRSPNEQKESSALLLSLWTSFPNLSQQNLPKWRKFTHEEGTWRIIYHWARHLRDVNMAVFL